MSAVALQRSAVRLGRRRWRVELAFAPGPHGAHGLPRVQRGGVSVRPHAGERARAHVESVTVASPSARERFGVVLAVEAEGGEERRGLRLELRGRDWRADVLLGEGEPAPRAARPPRSAPLDYRARDFWALRTMLLGVVDEVVGPGLVDHPVSQTGALVEQLAYLGDALGYSQDAIATEAYLATARRRISVVRHAALLDYAVGAGRSARAWVHIAVSEPLRLPAGTQLVTGSPELPARLDAAGLAAALAAGALVFETLEDAELRPGGAVCALRGGGDRDGGLPAGATGAELAGRCEQLAPGMLVLLEPAGAVAASTGQVVRLTEVVHERHRTRVAWAEADALADGALTQLPLRLRAGNLVLADHGATHDWATLPAPAAGRAYWPVLPVGRPAMSAGAARGRHAGSAAERLLAAGRPVRPAVALRSAAATGHHAWNERASLLESGPLDPDFVVEVEEDGTARLRFGDGVNGLRPPVGTEFEARVRSGGGSAGNVSAGAIAHVVGDDPRLLSVRNPMPAAGGADPEPLATVRLEAPSAFRITDRAVTPAQYSAVALGVAGVADATTAIVPTGSGPLARVRVHAGSWGVPAEPLARRAHAQLERRRPVGVALDVRPAEPIAARIRLALTAERGWALAAVAETVDRALRDGLLGPGRFRFATTLHRSDLVKLLAPLPGVADVAVVGFDWAGVPAGGPPRDELRPPFGHVIRIDDDPAVPQHGTLAIDWRTAA